MSRHYYAFEHTTGNNVWADSGKPVGVLHSFDAASEADKFVSEFQPPNHCPSAFAERATRQSIEHLLPKRPAWGYTVPFWDVSEDSTHYVAVI